MQWLIFTFQDGASPLMEQLLVFYDHGMLILTMIFSFISILIVGTMSNNNFDRFLIDKEELEVVWTIIPGVFLIFLAIPSLQVLYLMEEIVSPSLTLKVIGHQWYWEYELNDVGVSYDSFMKTCNQFRLLEVDSRLILPIFNSIRVMVTSEDVIHSWSLPSMGVKVDANPGRINMAHIWSFRSGTYYGQCSEICGINHSYMPIMLEFVPLKLFVNWAMIE